MKKNKCVSVFLLSVFLLVTIICAGTQVNTAVADTILKDVGNHWAATAINEMVNAGVVSGFPDGTFKPDNSISRAETAVLIVKTFEFNMRGSKEFADTKNHWAKDYIAAANANGVVKGYSNTKFGPDDPITREQMAVMVVAAANLGSTSTVTRFNDSSSISTWAKEAVAIATEQNIITGFPDGSFRPQATATRAQAVTVLKKADSDLVPVLELSRVDQPGNYGPTTGIQTIKGDVTISAAGATLQNVIVTGSLLISETVGDGDVTLNNVTVKGVTTIRGGGPNSIYFEGSTFRKVVINKPQGKVRLVLKNSEIYELVDNSGVNIVGNGKITKATFNTEGFSSEINPGQYTVASGKAGTISGKAARGDYSDSDGTSMRTVHNISRINDMDVGLGTAVNQIGLPAKITLNLNDGTAVKVNATFTCANYNSNVVGEYIFTGSYDLPVGVFGAKPRVTAKVIVTTDPAGELDVTEII